MATPDSTIDSTTDEGQIMTRYFDDLVNAIVEPGTVARSLYSAELIGEETREKAANEQIGRGTRAGNLISAVQAVVRLNPQSFRTFLQVLKRHPAGKLVVAKMEKEYYVSSGSSTSENVDSVQQVRRRPPKEQRSMLYDDEYRKGSTFDSPTQNPPHGIHKEPEESGHENDPEGLPKYPSPNDGEKDDKLQKDGKSSLICTFPRCAVVVGVVIILILLGYMFLITQSRDNKDLSHDVPSPSSGSLTSDNVHSVQPSRPPKDDSQYEEYKDCKDAYLKGHTTSGVYWIKPDDQPSFKVYCDMDTDGGGWTVFQRRMDGSVDFYRNWADYEQGFGNLTGEYWLGLRNIHRLTASAPQELRVDLADHDNNKCSALYNSFSIAGAGDKYRLDVAGYSGAAGNSLAWHSGMLFTTKDKDNDIHRNSNCARVHRGAWWYARCHDSNLNGYYYGGGHSSYADGVNWVDWKGYYYSITFSEMKTRRRK